MSTSFVSLGGGGGASGSGGAKSDDKKAKAKRKALKAMSDEQRRRAAIDITMEDLRSRLTVQNVADLVLLSMVSHTLAPQLRGQLRLRLSTLYRHCLSSASG